MPRVVHFEIPAEDPDRAVKFYSEVFNWKIEKWTGPVDYRLITTGSEDEPGINGAIMKRQNPQATVTNTIEIPSVDDFLKKAHKNTNISRPRNKEVSGLSVLERKKINDELSRIWLK